MLRAATPLTVLLLAALVLLILAVLSTPVIKSIPLGTVNGVNYGVFGFCNGATCSPIEIGYDASSMLTSQTSSLGLSSSTRLTLSSILIVHPIATAFTAAMLVAAFMAHFRSPSHSPRYLLAVVILSIFTFLLCLLAFLVDVLLFVPNMAWGSYVVLAATISVALSTLISFAMRKTLVARRARKRRIEENAEMSGENYYSRQQPQQESLPTDMLEPQPTIPLIGGANGGPTLPKVAEYTIIEKSDSRSSDERVPLAAGSPPRSQNTAPSSQSDLNYPRAGNVPGPSSSNASPPRDQYGNPIRPVGPGPYGVDGPQGMNSRGRGNMPPGGVRGRGGFPARGRGGYGSPGRGGYAPRGRGGYGPPIRGAGGPAYNMRRGDRPPPPPGYIGTGPYDRRQPLPADMYGANQQGQYNVRRDSPRPMAPSGHVYRTAPPKPGTTPSYEPPYNASSEEALPRAESPPPLPGSGDGVSSYGHAAARPGSPAIQPTGFAQYGIRDSDADVAGMLAMQQAKYTPERNVTVMTGSLDGEEDGGQYVPAREAWQTQGSVAGGGAPRMPSPLNVLSRTPPNGGGAAPYRPIQPVPAASEWNYEEFIPPRLADKAPPLVPPAAPVQGMASNGSPGPAPPPNQTTTNSHEDNPPVAQSPAESELSSFTSISQRGINPRWQSPPPQQPGFGPSPQPGFGIPPQTGPRPGGAGVTPRRPGGANVTPRRPGEAGVTPRRPVNRPNVLDDNPDFQLPSRLRPPRGPSTRLIPESPYPAGSY